jgi:hypothetical protein
LATDLNLSSKSGSLKKKFEKIWLIRAFFFHGKSFTYVEIIFFMSIFGEIPPRPPSKENTGCSSFTKCCYKCTLRRKCLGLNVANLINSDSKNDEQKPLYNPKEIMFSCSFSEKNIYQVAKIRPKNNTEQHTTH